MRRALQIASHGEIFTSPNPSVGAVIVAPDGRIIGEGFTSTWGGPHAEVNAVRSVKEADRQLLEESTIYVTLEPCSHQGKTPPCARMLLDVGIRKAVVGTLDPFPAVAGRGVAMLREGGVDVQVGLLGKECRESNRRFMLSHALRRPYILLKWAQSADGYLAGQNGSQVKFSTPLTQVLMHRERARVNAILAGTGTILADDPQLTCRLWPDRELRPVILNGSGRIPSQAVVMQNPRKILFDKDISLPEMLSDLYEREKLISLMVEGGAELLGSFLRAGLYDEIRVETSPHFLGAGIKAPEIPADLSGWRKKLTEVDGNSIVTLLRPV